MQNLLYHLQNEQSTSGLRIYACHWCTKEKSTGPNTEPCGTPNVMFDIEELEFLTMTYCFLLRKWCEGGLRQQRNDGGGCVTMHERLERVEESPGTCNWISFMRPFLHGTVFFRTTLPCSGGYHMERGRVRLHDEVGINCMTGATTENQGSGVKYMG